MYNDVVADYRVKTDRAFGKDLSAAISKANVIASEILVMTAVVEQTGKVKLNGVIGPSMRRLGAVNATAKDMHPAMRLAVTRVMKMLTLPP